LELRDQSGNSGCLVRAWGDAQQIDDQPVEDGIDRLIAQARATKSSVRLVGPHNRRHL